MKINRTVEVSLTDEDKDSIVRKLEKYHAVRVSNSVSADARDLVFAQITGMLNEAYTHGYDQGLKDGVK